VQSLAEGHAEEKHEQSEPDADAPPSGLLAATPSTAFPALDRRERAHGA
jgi:hypothetical protein